MGEMRPRTGAMERRCHPADHSLSAESCNGTPFSGILKALGRSRLLELSAISTAGPPARDLRSPGAYFV